MLNNKNILVGITGSIAAYKSALLVRLLVKAGANVKVVMTAAAKDFITPLTLSTLSKNPVISEFQKNDSGEWNNHIDLALWADAVVIAPATADIIAKMAYGVCDNFLLAVYLSARSKVYVAPAMDLDMYRHPATSANLSKLKSYGNILIQPGIGELASGLYGEGRMEEPENIYSVLFSDFSKNLPLNGKKALVTAGPTYEAIDPVRFIGNHSSGKMGFAIALELANRGAEVTLVCGPNSLSLDHPSVKRLDIINAEDMHKTCVSVFAEMDIAVLAAAVADYRPVNAAKQKIKKKDAVLDIELEPTKDTLASLGLIKSKEQVLVGFALETENEFENAQEKLRKKNLDLIILNSLRDAGAGFGTDTNKIHIIGKNNKVSKFELKNKSAVAADIVNAIMDLKLKA